MTLDVAMGTAGSPPLDDAPGAARTATPQQAAASVCLLKLSTPPAPPRLLWTPSFTTPAWMDCAANPTDHNNITCHHETQLLARATRAACLS